jgi:hypothetical protein
MTSEIVGDALTILTGVIERVDLIVNMNVPDIVLGRVTHENRMK